MRRIFSISGAMGFFLTLALQGKAADQPARISVTLPAGVKSVQLSYLDRTDMLHSRVLELKPAANSRTASAVLDLPFTEVIRIGGTYFMVSPGDGVSTSLTTRKEAPAVTLPRNINGNHVKRQRVLAIIDSIFDMPDSFYLRFNKDPRIVLYGKWQTCASVTDYSDLTPGEAEMAMTYIHTKFLPLRREFVSKESPEGVTEKYIPWLLGDVDVTSPWLDRIADDDLITQFSLTCSEVMGKIEKPVCERKEEQLMTGPLYILEHSVSDRAKYFVSKHYTPDFRFYGPNDPVWRRFFHDVDSSIQNPEGRLYCDSVWEVFQPLRAGEPAYDFVLESDKGKMFRLSDLRGKLVVMDWWATWCNGCVANLPYFEHIARKYKDSAGIVFINIATQEMFSRDTWHQFLKDHDMEGNINLILDECISDAETRRINKAYHKTGVPRYMAVDKDGKIIDLYMDFPESPAFEKRLAEYYQQQKSR